MLERIVGRDGERVAALGALAAAQERSEGLRRLEVLATADRPTAELARDRKDLKRELLLAPRDVGIRGAEAEWSQAERQLSQAEGRQQSACARLQALVTAPRSRRRRRRDLRLAESAVEVAAADVDARSRQVEMARQVLDAKEAALGARCESRQERLALVDDALDVQIRRAVEVPAGYLSVALGRRPMEGTVEREAWDRHAHRIESYRHLELALSPSDGPLGSEGLVAAVGRRPSDFGQRLQWDVAVGAPAPARGPDIGLSVGL